MIARADRRLVDGLVGLAIFLGATTMLFAGLLLVGASVALRAARPGVALACGAAFLAGQIGLWRHLVAAHLGPGAGPLGDVFFALTGFHALHVAAGLVVLVAARARRPRLATIYWDFVLAVWLVIYVAVCLT